MKIFFCVSLPLPLTLSLSSEHSTSINLFLLRTNLAQMIDRRTHFLNTPNNSLSLSKKFFLLLRFFCCLSKTIVKLMSQLRHILLPISILQQTTFIHLLVLVKPFFYSNLIKRSLIRLMITYNQSI